MIIILYMHHISIYYNINIIALIKDMILLMYWILLERFNAYIMAILWQYYTILYNYYISIYYNISIVELKLMWSEIDKENIKNNI